MADELKDRVLEIVAISKECPENLQPLCFELLLRDYLESRERAAVKRPAGSESSQPEPIRQDEEKEEEPPPSSGQQDLKIGDLHMKVRKFIHQHSVTMEHLNAVFYKEGDEIKPLYEDLKTTRMAEGQIRITLLQALVSAIKTGEFSANTETVRAESQLRKCYDKANFSKNFRNNATIFDGFDSYESESKLRLSEDGRKELAELVKELAK